MSITLISNAWHTNLKGNELLVLISLSDNASDEGYCFPSWETIMKKTKVSKGTLSKILKTLEDQGHIKREYRKRENGSNKSNGYWVHPIHSSEVEHQNHSSTFNNHSSEVEPYHSSEVELPYEPSQPNRKLEQSVKKTNKKEVSIIDAEVVDEFEILFDLFWKAYPLKKGRVKAIPALKKALKKTSIENIMHSLHNHTRSKQWQKDNGQYIPHATTWLNGERWDDEMTMADVSTADYVGAVLGGQR